MTRLFTFIFSIAICVTFSASAQSRLTLSVPALYSDVELQNNWSPPSAVNRKNEFDGTAFAHGVTLTYSFTPGFLVTTPNILMIVGFGYLNERFNVERPFDYISPLEPIFYTEHYSYHCLQTELGFSYHRSIGLAYAIVGQVSYNWLWTFKQDYTPTSNHGYGHLTQTSHNQTTFARKLIASIGIERKLSDHFLLSLDVLAPIYLRWRNDKIFNDDPSTFSRPKFSIGSSVGVVYLIGKHNQEKK